MKIAMICPTNLLFMPYVDNYRKILDDHNIDYAIINWDRLQMEQRSTSHTFRDDKKEYQRSFFDYYRYKGFVVQKLKENQFDKVIIFGLQLSFFLRSFVMKHYKRKYAIDIRDHNRIIDFFQLRQLFEDSALTVISSPGYKRFLPAGGEYVVNHNTQVELLTELENREVTLDKPKLRISYIGALRDYDVNLPFIHSLKGNGKIELFYHGEGTINQLLNEEIQKEQISNVYLTGRYEKEQEADLYANSDMINVFLSTNGINNKTLLPNRLYQSAKYKKPMIALEGSYLAELLKEYRLGLVIESFDRLEDSLNQYVINFNSAEFESGVHLFFKKVIAENQYFKSRLLQFCENELDGFMTGKKRKDFDEYILRVKHMLSREI